MHARYWPVGTTSETLLPLSPADIAAHLVSDWVPSLPATVTKSFMGWPPHLLKVHPSVPAPLMSIIPECGATERQWKAVLSWMLGVAGARQVLSKEGYQWIAPSSAFYPKLVQPVSTPSWHPRFPRPLLQLTRPHGSRVRLMPDYVAIRISGGKLQWAAVEVKGTKRALQAMDSCSRDWSNQARNVTATVGGAPLTIDRHLVVATRVNPNGLSSKVRCLQVRAWNSDTPAEDGAIGTGAASEIAAAALFGLFMNLELFEHARSIGEAVDARKRVTTDQPLAKLRPGSVRYEAAEVERSELTVLSDVPGQFHGTRGRVLNTELGQVVIELSPPLLQIADHLIQADSPEEADEAVLQGSRPLSQWMNDAASGAPIRTIVRGAGFRALFPDRYLSAE